MKNSTFLQPVFLLIVANIQTMIWLYIDDLKNFSQINQNRKKQNTAEEIKHYAGTKPKNDNEGKRRKE